MAATEFAATEIAPYGGLAQVADVVSFSDITLTNCKSTTVAFAPSVLIAESSVAAVVILLVPPTDIAESLSSIRNPKAFTLGLAIVRFEKLTVPAVMS